MIIIDKQLDFTQPTKTEQRVINFENKVRQLTKHLKISFEKKVKYCIKKKLLQKDKSFNRIMLLIQKKQKRINRFSTINESVENFLRENKDVVVGEFSPHCVAN